MSGKGERREWRAEEQKLKARKGRGSKYMNILVGKKAFLMHGAALLWDEATFWWRGEFGLGHP